MKTLLTKQILALTVAAALPSTAFAIDVTTPKITTPHITPHPSGSISRGWVTKNNKLPNLNGNANGIAIQHIKIENEGFERDMGVAEPAEPSLSTTSHGGHK